MVLETRTEQITQDDVECKVLPSLAELLAAFETYGVRYLHWKSNTNIANALSGKDDFDILIHPEDRELCEDVFSRQHFLRAYSPKDAWQPGVFHFIKPDTDGYALVHLHVHYALPIGYDFNKNFVMPVVDGYIASRWKYGPVFLPTVEMEYIILVLRLVLKNGLDTFLLKPPHKQLHCLGKAKSGVIKPGDLVEFEDLKNRVNPETLAAELETTWSFVTPSVFSQCEEAIQNNNSLREYFKAAGALKKQLRSFAVCGSFIAFCKAWTRLNKARLSKISARIWPNHARKNKQLRSGGRIMAFVGGDGAGKSTNVEALYNLLSRQLSVVKLHIGRPQYSFRGAVLQCVTKILRKCGVHTYAQLLALCRVALDRRATIRKARRLRRRGWIVIMDRFPLQNVTHMDCPRIASVANGKYKRLARWEQELYKDIYDADCLIVLKLNPDIAKQRRPEDDQQQLALRSGEIWHGQWESKSTHAIDTGEYGLAEVKRQALTIAWQCMRQPFYRIELIGLSGAGKSTVARELRRQFPNSRSTLPFRSYPVTAACGALLGVPTAIRIYKNSRNKEVARNGLFLFAACALIKRFEQRGAPAMHFFFDQGPVFRYVLAEKEKGLRSNKSAEIGKWTCGFMECIFRLKVDSEELYHRVHNVRGETIGRASQLKDKEEFVRFCSDYDAVFDRVEKNLNKTVRIDASLSKHELVKNIMAELRQ